MRIDKFLKVSRILKRRSLAKDACDAKGSVKFRILQVKETVKKDEAQTLYEVIA